MWIKTYGFDGFRLDAVKHIETALAHRPAHARSCHEVEATTKQHVYLVGETFTGDQNAHQVVHLALHRCSTGSSTSRCARSSCRTCVMRQGKMHDLVGFMDTNTSFYGTSVMSTFLGNHDVPRTIHFAEDTPLWSRRVGQRQGSQLVESAGAAGERQRLRAARARLRRLVDQPRRAAHLLRRRDRPRRRRRSRQPPHDDLERGRLLGGAERAARPR